MSSTPFTGSTPIGVSTPSALPSLTRRHGVRDLAAERMDAHAESLDPCELASH